MAEYKIDVIVDPAKAEQGVKAVERHLDTLSKTANRLRGLIQGALSFVGLGYGIKTLADLADSYTQASNRIRTVTKDTNEQKVVMEKLFKVASQTGVRFNEVVETYTRTASAASRLGRSQKELIDFSSRLNKAVVISGATTNETTGALIQLSQGIGSATLRGQELRSVLTQLPAVADIIVKEFNRMEKGAHYTRASLKDLGMQGKITPKIILDAFKHDGENIDAAFAKIAPTIQRSVQTLRTNLIKLMGDFNQSTGAQGTFAKAILWVAENLETLGRIALAVGTMLGLNYAQKAMTAAITATRAFFVLLRANPLGALVTALTFAITLAVAFGDQIKIGGGHVADFRDLAIETFESVKSVGQDLVNWFKDNFPEISLTILDVWDALDITAVVLMTTTGLDYLYSHYVSFTTALITLLGTVPERFSRIMKEMYNGLVSWIEDSTNFMIRSINSLTDKIPFGKISKISHFSMEGYYKDTSPEDNAIAQAGTFTSNRLKGFNVLNENSLTAGAKSLFERADTRAIARMKKEAEEKKLMAGVEAGLAQGGEDTTGTIGGKREKYETIIQRLKDENEAYLKVGNAQTIALEKAKLLGKIKEKLTDTEKANLENLIKINVTRKQEAEILENIIGPMDALNVGTDALNDLFARHLITVDQYNQKLRELKIAALDADRTISGGFQQGLLKIEEQFTNLADVTSTTLVNAFQSAEDALVEFANTGKTSFSDMAKSILNDIQRILIRQNITGPIAALFGGGNSQWGGAPASSNGSLLATALQIGRAAFFADGDIFGSPTAFTYGNGKTGVMGESGPEGVLPLKRNAQGKLGVIASVGGGGNINIQNNTTVNVSNSGTGSQKENSQLAATVAEKVQQQVHQYMTDFTRKQQRQGGMLNKGANV